MTPGTCTLRHRHFLNRWKAGITWTKSTKRKSALFNEEYSHTHRERLLFSRKKEMERCLFTIPQYTANVEKTSGRHLVVPFARLSRRHNGTNQLQMCRCSAKQQGPFFLLIHFFFIFFWKHRRAIKQMSAAPTWHESQFSNFPDCCDCNPDYEFIMVGGRAFHSRNPSLFAFARGIPRMLFQYS